MSRLQSATPPRVVAILTSDWHLSEKPPVARSAEEDWFETQKRYLRQIGVLSRRHGIAGIPIICAGDIFDKWNSSANLINFAISEMPHVYAVPGQHDLAHHNYENIRKTAYWTLVEAGKVTDLRHGSTLGMGVQDLVLHAFPWNHEIRPREVPSSLCLHIAVIHCYIWKKGFGYPGAPKDKRVGSLLPRLKGYDVAVFGDNHLGFQYKNIFNCGGLMRRKSDEINYAPGVGLLYSDGTVKRHYLDTSGDKFIDPSILKKVGKDGVDMEDFIEELKSLGDQAINFHSAIREFIDKHEISEEVANIVIESMES